MWEGLWEALDWCAISNPSTNTMIQYSPKVNIGTHPGFESSAVFLTVEPSLLHELLPSLESHDSLWFSSNPTEFPSHSSTCLLCCLATDVSNLVPLQLHTHVLSCLKTPPNSLKMPHLYLLFLPYSKLQTRTPNFQSDLFT